MTSVVWSLVLLIIEYFSLNYLEVIYNFIKYWDVIQLLEKAYLSEILQFYLFIVFTLECWLQSMNKNFADAKYEGLGKKSWFILSFKKVLLYTNLAF